MFLYYFLSLKKLLIFFFQDGTLWNSGSQEAGSEPLTPLPPSSRYWDYIPYVVYITIMGLRKLFLEHQLHAIYTAIGFTRITLLILNDHFRGCKNMA